MQFHVAVLNKYDIALVCSMVHLREKMKYGKMHTLGLYKQINQVINIVGVHAHE